MPNIVFKADASEFMNFVESLTSKSHLLKSIPNEFILGRLKDLAVFESAPAAEAGHIVVKFGIRGTVESFIASTLRAFEIERLAHDPSVDDCSLTQS